ncbi:GAF domain-containing sensor histidine kinase [Massilia sp. CF038]|uniref:GAF domain-containing sensor histidine kinase n=1 Tax=Massilia sp. CF038 TaxID=1881045 RepID=UPI001E3147FB|nr:GAF domain-containing sensor histidine kinase [Massilia sp. CF038]
MTASALASDIASIQSISSVSTILEAVSALTGLRFVCIARVTDNSWNTCAVLDQLGFGLKVGDELDVATTLCEEVRDTRLPVVIDHVSEDPKYRDHHTPRIYGFQSYISIPVFRPDGSYFGTLCGLDPKPAQLSNTATIASMTLFAQLITKHLETERKLSESQTALFGERETSELREQFIAVLGHDLRTPLGSVLLGIELLRNEGLSARALSVLERMQRSAQRMSGLVNDVVDFTRGKMGGGIALNLTLEPSLRLPLMQVVDELRAAHPERDIEVDLQYDQAVLCDVQRIQQMLSNLLKNALVYGDPTQPVRVRCSVTNGIFELAIINHGPAIAQSTIDQLFKPFWRASAHAANEGLGLGLFIVSEIARSHGGEMAVASSAGTTRFVFRLKGAQFVERRKIAR